MRVCQYEITSLSAERLPSSGGMRRVSRLICSCSSWEPRQTPQLGRGGAREMFVIERQLAEPLIASQQPWRDVARELFVVVSGPLA